MIPAGYGGGARIRTGGQDGDEADSVEIPDGCESIGADSALQQASNADQLARIAARCEWVDDCLVWTGNRGSSGYGQLRVDGRMQSVHRLVWTLHHGPIPPGLVVMHGCDNPACVDLDHLLLGTQRANVLDRERKGRGVVPDHQRPRL